MAQEPPRQLPLDKISPNLLVFGLRSWLYLGILACALAGLLMISTLSSLIVPLIVAVVIAMLFYPVVDWMAARSIPRTIGTLVVMIGLLTVVAGSLWLAAYGVISQTDQIAKLVDSGMKAADTWAGQLSLPVGFFDWAVTNALNAVPQVLAGVGSFFSSSFSGAIALFVGLFLGAFLLFYLLSDWHGVVNWLAGNIGLEPHLGETVIDNTTQSVRRYFYALTLSSVVVSITIGGTMALLGLPLAFTIGLVTMVTSYVPYLGAIVSGVFACLVALGSGGVGTAVFVLIIVLLMQNIIQTIIQNRLASSQLSLHPLVTFIVTIVGGTLGGVIGAMLATPATAAVIRALQNIRRLRTSE
jgi:predicted PurR-regulated permease PerM